MNDHMMNEKKWNALRTALLTAVAVMLVLSAVMGSAWAYFTTYARAKGGYPIVLGHEEHDDETLQNWEKTLSITVSKIPDRFICAHGLFAPMTILCYLVIRRFLIDVRKHDDPRVRYMKTGRIMENGGTTLRLYSPVDSGKDKTKMGKMTLSRRNRSMWVSEDEKIQEMARLS